MVSGGKQASKATYVPNVYAKAQSDWIDGFLAQNGYLEYDALQRLGITEPQTFVKRKFKDENMTFLSSCCVGQTIIDNLEANVDEAIANGSFVEVTPFLPSVLSDKDTALILQHIYGDAGSKSGRKRSTSNVGKTPLIFAETVVTCQNFLDRLVEPFKDKARDKAAKVVNNGEYAKATKDASETVDYQGQEVVDRKEERRKKAAGGAKSGGGTQGREGKTKSTKNKKNKRDEEPVVVQAPQIPDALKFMDMDDISVALRDVSILQDCADEFVECLAQHLHPSLNSMYLEIASELHRSTVTSSMQKKRKTHVEFQEKTLALIDNIRLFEKGLQALQDPSGLEKYLLKSLCSELVNGIFVQVANEQDIDVANADLNADQRLKMLGQIPKTISEHLLPIHKALASSASDLLKSLEDHLNEACDVLMKKIDKKKDRQLLFAHRQSLLEQIESSQEPSQLLLLVCLVIFQFQTGQMIHASGKFVPGLVSQISNNLDNQEDAETLKKYQSLVIEKMQAKNDEDKAAEIQANLEQLTPKVREVATNAKKTKS